MDSEKEIELMPVDEQHSRGRGSRRGGRGRGRGRGHGRERYNNRFNDEETLNDSEDREEKEESLELISGENKGKIISRLVKKNSKDDEEIIKAELEQKKKFIKSYGKCELIRKSLKSENNCKNDIFGIKISLLQLF